VLRSPGRHYESATYLHLAIVAVRAVFLGFAVLFVCYAFVSPIYMRLDTWLSRFQIANIHDVWLSGYSVVAHLIIGGTFSSLAGFVVGVTHRRDRRIVVPIFFGAVLLLQSVEVVPEMIAAGPERDWRKLLLDLTFIRLPILVSGLFLVRDRQ
jgi:hypothetical protein